MQFSKRVTIDKVDDEQRIVWGWAYVSEQDGAQVVDHSGDVIDAAEVQKAAHAFVTESRTGGELHLRKAGRVVDSIFFSKAVQQALGIDLRKVGWFIGFQVEDDQAWAGVKSGVYKAFSIGGDAEEVEIDAAA